MEETRAVKECSDPGKGSVPDMETGCCLGSEGNGVRAGGRGEGGPGPPEKEKVKQLMPSKNRDNMEKDEEEQSNRA
jgi:hypothetical protein